MRTRPAAATRESGDTREQGPWLFVALGLGLGLAVALPILLTPTPADRQTAPPGRGSEPTVVKVIGRSFAFEPATLTVAAGTPFEIALQIGPGEPLHDRVIEGHEDQPVGAIGGMTGSGFFELDRPGTYGFFCAVEGHREAGMQGSLTVTASPR